MTDTQNETVLEAVPTDDPNVISTVEVKPAEVSKPAQINEFIIWNNTGNTISIGCAILHGDQLHLDILSKVDVDKQNLTPEQRERLSNIKPKEATKMILSSKV